MEITEARMSGTWLMLNIKQDDLNDARRFCYNFKPGNHEVKQVKVKRSLNANALMWKLCGEIGKAINQPATYVYQRAVKEGNVFTTIELPSDAVERFVKDWRSRGQGWVVQIIDGYGGRTTLNAYYGSSTYNVHEMSDLIDRLMQDAEALGIDCLSERERSLIFELV